MADTLSHRTSDSQISSVGTDFDLVPTDSQMQTHTETGRSYLTVEHSGTACQALSQTLRGGISLWISWDMVVKNLLFFIFHFTSTLAWFLDCLQQTTLPTANQAEPHCLGTTFHSLLKATGSLQDRTTILDRRPMPRHRKVPRRCFGEHPQNMCNPSFLNLNPSKPD